jgi:hypothetical protein
VFAGILVTLKGNGSDALAGTRPGAVAMTPSVPPAPPVSGSSAPPSSTGVDRYSSLRSFVQEYVKTANEDAARGKPDRVKSFHCGSDQVGWVYLSMSVDRTHPRAELQDVKLLNNQAGAATVTFTQSPGADPTPAVKLQVKAQGPDSWCVNPW